MLHPDLILFSVYEQHRLLRLEGCTKLPDFEPRHRRHGPLSCVRAKHNERGALQRPLL